MPKTKKNLKETITPAQATIIAALVTAVIGGYLAYQSAITPTRLQIQATQTKEALTVQQSSPLVQTSAPAQTLTITNATPSFTPYPIHNQPSSLTFVKDPSTGYRVIYPICNCVYRTSSVETILVRLRWGSKTAELAENGANLLSYSLIINGNTINNLNSYREPAILEKTPILDMDDPNGWWVYWDYPVKLERKSSPYSIQVNLKTLSAIDNGWNIIPAGFTDQFHVTVEVYKVPMYP